MSWVRLRMTVPACSIWSLKNSPKFFMYILHFLALTTVTALPNCISHSLATSPTALATSESLPTPEGSMRMRSGWYCSSTFRRAWPKSPTREQQIQPEFISVTWMPASLRKPPSMPISPNSFSIRTIFWPEKDSASSFLINVVFPAPKKPEIISMVVIRVTSLLINKRFNFYCTLNAEKSKGKIRSFIGKIRFIDSFYKMSTGKEKGSAAQIQLTLAVCRKGITVPARPSVRRDQCPSPPG